MWTKLLPEAGGRILMFLPEPDGGGQIFCRRLGSNMPWNLMCRSPSRHHTMWGKEGALHTSVTPRQHSAWVAESRGFKAPRSPPSWDQGRHSLKPVKQ